MCFSSNPLDKISRGCSDAHSIEVRKLGQAIAKPNVLRGGLVQFSRETASLQRDTNSPQPIESYSSYYRCLELRLPRGYKILH